ncbi:hypothetical protein BO068_004999 [Escherichia coli]|nr:hypothetical protein [Salmonella enterica subsp. enterica serovar Virchow]EBW2250126.1 hypothetical protein [Salmonella enterica subsp. enterica serovar Enteritidis]EFG2885805.1 hypothetical protein [Escherichia coli]EFG8200229.1 hypothetical protein [Escherichia coli]
MTSLLEQAIERVRAMPEETQDAFARLLLQLAGDNALYQLDSEELADLEAAEQEVARGETVGDEALRQVLRKYRH